MSNNSIPGICEIRILRCADLTPNVMYNFFCNNRVAIAAPSVPVEFIGKPVLSWETTKLNKLGLQKATLEFRTLHPLPEGENLAFVVTAAGGMQFLVGAKEGRFPVISYTATTGDPSGDAAVLSYKVTYIALKAVLPCIL